MLIYPQGNVADGQPDFGKSMKIGSIARTALPVAQADGTRIPILVDEFGRLIMAGGSLSGVQMVEGDVAHDDPDLITMFPVKVGQHANASPPAAVAENDRVNWSGTLFGQGRVAISGVDGGGTARDISPQLPADITDADYAIPVSDFRGRMIAPASGDSSQQDVTSAAAVSFTTVAGRLYWITALQDMNFLDGSAPTSTTGAIVPAGGMVGPIEAASTSFQFIARGTTGRVSVEQVNP